MTDRILAASELGDCAPIDARSRPLHLEEVPAEQAVEGRPRTGLWELESSDTVSLGVWEMTAGSMTDVEADEVFVVVDGEATVTATTADGATRSIELRPGDICRLSAGTTTRWDVPRLLRKVYIQGVPRDLDAGIVADRG